MGLENLRSIFAPINESDFVAESERSIHINNEGLHLDNHTLFDDGLTDNITIFSTNRPQDKFDTKLFNQPTQFIATNPTDFSTAGLGKVPFSPIGLNLYNGEENNSNPQVNMSWQSLYVTNQKNKNNSGWGGLSPISYNENVNRDKLNIRSSSPNQPFFRNAIAGIIPEPYIVSNIPRSSSDISSGRVINFGGRDLPIARLATDALRVGAFLSSPAGITFFAKQNLLGANTKSVFISKDGKLQASKQRFKSTYNPLSTLIQTGLRAGGFPLALMDRSEPDLSTLGGGTILPGLQDFLKSPKYGGSDTIAHDINQTFTGGSAAGESNELSFKNFKKGIENQVKSALGKVSTIRHTSHGGDKVTLQNMITGESLDTLALGGTNGLKFDVEAEKEGMPFYFKDLRDSTYIFFRAYIEGLTENISPSYSSHNYIGRSEPLYTYERAEREISMTLKLVAQTREELTMIYRKMDRLTSMCYPEYVDDDYGSRMKPPLTKLRIGEMFGKANKEQLGYIKSISYAVDNSSTYETEVGKRVPRHVIATIGYQVIHEKAPRLGTTFYGINETDADNTTTDGGTPGGFQDSSAGNLEFF